MAALIPVVLAAVLYAPAQHAKAAIGCRRVNAERPNEVSGDVLNAIAATSRCNAWAVGINFALRGDETLIAHWDGRRWQRVGSPSPNATRARRPWLYQLNAVAATSFDNAWAVGEASVFSQKPDAFEHGYTVIDHWDGRRWKEVHSPNPDGTFGSWNDLTAVAAAGRDDAWAVGSSYRTGNAADHTLMEHWNGRSWNWFWTPTPTDASNVSLSGVAVTSADNAWAVGYWLSNASVRRRILIEHWNGTDWNIVPSPDLAASGRSISGELDAVAATSGANVWAVGSYARPGTGPRALTLHWNGSTWTQIPAVNPWGRYRNVALYGVATTSSSRAWAVGGYGFNDPRYLVANNRAMVERWNGAKWIFVRSPRKVGEDTYVVLTAVTAIARGVMATGTQFCGWAEPAAERLIHGIFHLVATPFEGGNPCTRGPLVPRLGDYERHGGLPGLAEPLSQADPSA